MLPQEKIKTKAHRQEIFHKRYTSWNKTCPLLRNVYRLLLFYKIPSNKGKLDDEEGDQEKDHWE